MVGARVLCCWRAAVAVLVRHLPCPFQSVTMGGLSAGWVASVSAAVPMGPDGARAVLIRRPCYGSGLLCSLITPYRPIQPPATPREAELRRDAAEERARLGLLLLRDADCRAPQSAPKLLQRVHEHVQRHRELQAQARFVMRADPD